MYYRTMGETGLKLSEVSIGGWITLGDQIEDKSASRILHAAYENGINYFDNADIYANGRAEIVMGKALSDLPREALVISSKVWAPTLPGVNGRGLSRKHVMEALHASLKRLDVDYLDLYFCHRPDPGTPMTEVVRAMDDLIHQGKVLYWGTSEWRASQIAEAKGIAMERGLYPPTVEQPQYNMLVRQMVEDELAPAAKQMGIGLVTWSPLQSGLLSGKYVDGKPPRGRLADERYEGLRAILTDENTGKVQRLSQVASDLGVTLPQLAIGWLLRLPEVTSVITGATKTTQVSENVKAVDVARMLTPAVLDRIEAILENKLVRSDYTAALR